MLLIDLVTMVTPTQIIQFIKSTGKAGEDNSQWLAYCAFHSGDYQRAKDVSTPEFMTTMLYYEPFTYTCIHIVVVRLWESGMRCMVECHFPTV